MKAALFALGGLFCLSVITADPGVTISVAPLNATLTLGQNLTIMCDSGNDAHEVLLKINEEIATDSQVEVISGPDSFEKKIYSYSSVKRSDNNFNFTCFSQEDDGLSSLAVTLAVLYPPLISSLINGTGFERESAKVTFSVDANPRLNPANVSVTPAQDPPRTVSINGNTVTIVFSTLQRKDKGSYTVVGENSEGSDEEIFYLDVYYGPTFAESNGTEYVVVGNSISLNCEVSETNPHSPNLTFSTTATDNGNVNFNTSNMEIIISNAILNNTGNYTCTANNEEANQSLNFEVLVGDLPDISVNVTASYESGMIDVTFVVSGSDNSITRYEVLLTQEGSNSVSLSNCTCNGLPPNEQYSISKLNDSDYNVTVNAFNIYGYSIVGMDSLTFPLPSPSPSLTPSTAWLAGVTLLMMLFFAVTVLL